MSLKLNKYLTDLRNNANRLERIDINGNETKSFFGKYSLRAFFSLISASFVYILNGGFSDMFISYASTVLSILIGLFITAIIFSFDKFYKHIDPEVANSKEKLWDTQAYNYSKQFAFIIGYNIVLCIFAIVILSFSALFKDFFGIELHRYTLCINKINLVTFTRFCKLALVAMQRFFIFYWMLRIMYNTLFVVSSMVKFMTVKIDRENDSN